MALDAGNTLSTALNFGNLSGNSTFTWNELVGTNDQHDYYRFSLSTASTISLTLNGLSDDADLQLLAQNGTLLGFSDNSSTTPEAINLALTAGVYYVHVYPFETANTSYTLSFQGTGTGIEPGNTLATALDLGTFNSRQWTFTDAVSAADSTDVYQIQLLETRLLNLRLTNLTADSDLFLLDSNGNLLDFSDNGSNQSELINRQLGAGIYYILVESFQGSSTEYSLLLEDQPPDFAGNTFATARDISVSNTPTAYSDFVGTIDSDDYYRFTLATTGNFNLALTGLVTDANVQLFNSSGAVVGQSLRPGATDDTINQILAAGNYYIRVFSLAGTSAGSSSYSLRVSAIAPSTATNILPSEIDVSNLSSVPVTFTGTIDAANTADVYRLTLADSSNLNASLTGLSSDVDIHLIRDRNNNGVVDVDELLARSERGNNLDEAINIATLPAGTYFVLVYQYSGASNYTLRLSATPPSPTTQPSNLLPTEVNAGILGNTASVFNGIIGTANAVDTYRFSLSAASNFNATLTGLGNDIDLRLIRDANNNGIVDLGEEVARSQAGGATDEAINLAGLATGTYFLQVYQFSGDFSGYTLRLSTTPDTVPSNLLISELELGTLSFAPFTLSDTISEANTSDIYRFTLDQAGTLNARLSGLTADADLRLVRDLNNNGITDEGEEIIRSELGGTDAESIITDLAAGTYFIQVYQFSGSTSYSLSVSAIPPDLAGKSLRSARSITISSTPTTIAEFVGTADTDDYYRFTLAERANFNLALIGLTADADVALLSSNGALLNRSINALTADEAINQTLEAGTYYIRVYAFSGSTRYGLQVSTTPPSFNTPSNLLPVERDAGLLSVTPTTFTGNIETTNTADVFRFRLGAIADFTANLTGLTENLDIRLLQDTNGNGVIDATDELIRSQAIGTAAETITVNNLAGGTYFIQVYQATGNSVYSLSLAATSTPGSTDPGNTLTTAEAQNQPIFSRSQQVSTSDRDDYYRFSLTQSGIFTASLTGLGGDADVRLIRDSNNNGAIDTGEVLAWQWERGTGNESLRRFLTTGTYFLQVNSYNNQTADYSLATNFTAAASDTQTFSIQVNFVAGAEALSEAMRTAVQEAARFWENVITYSSFDGAHVLSIDVGGTPQNWTPGVGGVLASAGPRSIEQDRNGNWMPISGLSNINSNPDAVTELSSSIDYFRRIMIHEFGHVLGIGTFWGSEFYGRNLVNRTAGTYNATSYAGWAYGDLLGTFTQTAVPVTTGVGPGSDYAHWREQTFSTEIMTHAANRSGMPLSQITIAGLRDLGWNINYGAAETYVLPATTSSLASTTSTAEAPTLSSAFNVRCGCAAHLAATAGFNTIGATDLARKITLS